MPRREKKYHYIYKTTCSLTNRFYYGMHSTDNLNDNYLGSGTQLWKSIKKYSKENHSKEILEYLHSRKDLKRREAEIVNEEMIRDPLCMNLAKGGNGSDYNLGLVIVKDKDGNTMAVSRDDPRYLSGELKYIFYKKFNAKDENNRIFKISKNDPRYLSGELTGLMRNRKRFIDENNNVIFIEANDPRILNNNLSNFRHSKETKEKIGKANSIKQIGNKNSQYGTCWITNGKENTKIKRGDDVPKGFSLGRKMQK